MEKRTSQILAEAAYLAGAESGSSVISDVLALTSLVTHHDASAVMLWDPVSGQHRGVAASGYPAQTLAGLGDRYAQSPEHERLLQLRSPLRIDDLPYDYRRTDIFHEVLEPTGFHDGLTVCLFRSDSSYSGMLHLSAGSPQSFDDDAVQIIAAIAPIITRLSIQNVNDGRSTPSHTSRVSLVSASGQIASEPPFERASLTSQPNFVQLVQRFLSTPVMTDRGIWPSTREWLSVELHRVANPLDVDNVIARVREDPGVVLPFGLTARETDILQGIALGKSNLQIAFDRSISVRTVTTHVERILAKTGQASRAGAVAVAAQHKLLLLRY